MKITLKGHTGGSALGEGFGIVGDQPRQLLQMPTKFVCACSGRKGESSHVDMKPKSYELHLQNTAKTERGDRVADSRSHARY